MSDLLNKTRALFAEYEQGAQIDENALRSMTQRALCVGGRAIQKAQVRSTRQWGEELTVQHC